MVRWLLRYCSCVAQINARRALMSVRARHELFEVDPLLHVVSKFVVHWIQIWVLGPQA